ncbi:CDP-alcohol phosphatidyltransferase family protein [Halovulum sp. GXIMD14794]
MTDFMHITRPGPDPDGLARSQSRVLVEFLGAAALGVCALLLAASILPHGVALPVLLGLFGMAVAGLWLQVARHYPHGDFGWCNTVTLMRGALVLALTSPLVAGETGWLVVIVASITLALDGVDGWLARNRGLVSAFGARFDMEVDSGFALVLAMLAFAAGKAGPEVLLLGTARYIFIGASFAMPWLAAPLPERFSRKAVCVLQLSVLIALQAPIITMPLSGGLAFIAAAALAWSFGRDILWLHRERG